MEKIKIGIIGAGRIGKVHAESITYHIPGAEVIAISDPFANDETKQWAASLGLDPEIVCQDHASILNDPNVEAVLICSPTNTHAQFIQEAAKAKKHIFCEKPVDLSVEVIRETLTVVEQWGVKFQVGFNRRFDKNFMKVKETVTSGGIGDPHILKITSRDPSPPPIEYVKVSGTLFLDMMIHDFDMARYLVDSEVVEVYTQGACRIDSAIADAGDVDTATVSLRFADGTLGIIDNSRKAVYGYDQRVEVFGSAGAVEADNEVETSVKLMSVDTVATEKPLHFFLERYMGAYVTEMNAFIESIQGSAPIKCDGKDGLESVRIGLAAKKSHFEKRPVKLSEIN